MQDPRRLGLSDWDDLRYVLAVARAGGLAGAAAALGVNHSTAFRRLNALEARLGVALFERLPAGYAPTAAGERLVRAAERIEAEALAVDREITGEDRRLSGRLRVTASETLAYRVLTAEIARFRAEHRGIAVELVLDNRALDLARREADVALRAARPSEGGLFGRKLADIRWAGYAAPGYVAARGAPGSEDDLARHDVIGWGEPAAAVHAAQWIARGVPASAVAYRSSSVVNQLVAAGLGMGIAILPCYLGDAEPQLRRVLPPIPGLVTELWLVTHDDLRRTARVRAFMDMVGEGVRRRLAAIAAGMGEDG